MQERLGWEGPLPLNNFPQPITNNGTNAAGEGTSQAFLPPNLPFQFQYQHPTMGLPASDGASSYFDPLASLMNKHDREIDHFLHQQEQNLRVKLLQQRNKFTVELHNREQMNAVAILNQKERELFEATSRLMKLQEAVKRAEEEKFKWQAVAAEQEALVVELNRKIEEINMKNAADEESIGSSGDSPQAKLWEKGKCRCCGLRDSRVVLVPCGHLCSCEICDPSLSLCPFCGSPKESSIEVLME